MPQIPKRIAEVLLVRESTVVALLEDGGTVGNCKSTIETSRVCIDEVGSVRFVGGSGY